MLENGFMPTEEMLAAMGLSSDQAQAYIDFYKQMAANTTKYSSGSSGGSSSIKVSNNTDNNVPPAPTGDEPDWGNGYSENRNQSTGVKGSTWDMIKQNVTVNLRNGNYDAVEKYMDQIAGGLNREQWNELAVLLQQYGYTGIPTY